MSLGAAALKVSGRPNAISREEVSMATLEAGTTPRVTTKRHQNTEWNTVDILTSENTVLQNHPARREEREQESAVIRKTQKLIRYDQQAKLQCNATLTKEHTRSPTIPQGSSGRRPLANPLKFNFA